MTNTVCLLGRLVKDPELKELESGKKVCNMTIAVQRSYKNADGIYEADFIDCSLWEGVALNMTQYCKKGDLIAVKGRLQQDKYEKDGEHFSKINVIAEKMTFIATKNKEDKTVSDNERDER